MCSIFSFEVILISEKEIKWLQVKYKIIFQSALSSAPPSWFLELPNLRQNKIINNLLKVIQGHPDWSGE